MILRLTPRVGRVAALTLAAGLFGCLVWLAAVAIFAGDDPQAEQIALLRRQAETMEGLAAAAPDYEKLAKKLAMNGQIQGLAFATPQTQIAVAQLQSQISQTITANGATVSTSQALPEAKDRALTKISVSATFETDIKSLVAVVQALRAARPLIFVDKLTIRDPDGEFATQPTAPAKDRNKLQVELIVVAYVRQI